MNELLNHNLIFINGKGGVGKSSLTAAVARKLSLKSKRVLWVSVEDPTVSSHEKSQLSPYLWRQNIESMSAFEEYIGLKIGVPLLVKLFLQNQLIRFLAKAAPGIRELVLVGKIWYERSFYDHVVVDMPSTGYALAMFQSIQNFSQLFKVGPIQGDTVKMHETLGDPQQAAQVIVSIAEETPLRESLELRDSLIKIYPRAQPIFVANKIYPRLKSAPTPDSQETGTPSPLARDGLAFIQSRNEIERANLQIWIDAKIPFTKIPYFPIEQDSLFEKRWMEALI